MSRNTGNKPAAPRKGGSPLLTGILIGMVIGVAMAAGLAWYIMKSPSPFVQKEPIAGKQPVAATKPPIPSGSAAPEGQTAMAASGVGGGKPRFEFYKVLTDKQDAAIAAPAAPVDKPQPPKPQAQTPQQSQTEDIKPGGTYFLQTGSFANADDAEKHKAKLAMLGIEASIQTVNIPDKGVWHRVRSGPYKNTGDADSARTLLKQNGVDSTLIRP
jgi:cell division protein FtsN